MGKESVDKDATSSMGEEEGGEESVAGKGIVGGEEEGWRLRSGKVTRSIRLLD
jgi:hypothetical protein